MEREPSSFRDPSGFIFSEKGIIFRQVNPSYLPIYEAFKTSGLYEALTTKGLLIAHAETGHKGDTLTLRPERIPFVSYPYEWCFSQLKDAALLTLETQRVCLEHGFSLKDASAFNVQFLRGKPVFIDTLSFEPYAEGSPWVAYRQFCQHFLAPLALMAKVDVNLGRLSSAYIDGVPLELASRLLPTRTKFTPGLYAHIHLHAKSQRKHANNTTAKQVNGRMSKLAHLGFLDSLETTVKGLTPHAQQTEWENYYAFTNYSDEAEKSKKKAVSQFIALAAPKTVWDLGANTGEYSRLASDAGIQTVAADIDPLAIEHCYRDIKKSGEANLLPLMLDLTNPSPAIGWDNDERGAFLRRQSPDLVMALALIHHLAISNNLPLERIAAFLARVAGHTILEFVPKEDSQVKKLLATREDIFPDYTKAGFEKAFKGYFTIEKQVSVKGSERTLYLLKRLH